MKVAIIDGMSLAFGYHIPATLVSAIWCNDVRQYIPNVLRVGDKCELEITAAAEGYELVEADALFKKCEMTA